MNHVSAPQTVRLRKALQLLEVHWSDGLVSEFSSFTLRRMCACSLCLQAKQQGLVKLIDAHVGIDRLEVSGISGLQLFFTDGHNKGLYPWGYLRELGESLQ